MGGTVGTNPGGMSGGVVALIVRCHSGHHCRLDLRLQKVLHAQGKAKDGGGDGGGGENKSGHGCWGAVVAVIVIAVLVVISVGSALAYTMFYMHRNKTEPLI